MAEPIEMSSGVSTRVGPSKHVLDGGAHWRHLANTIEPSTFGGDAAFCQITLTIHFNCSFTTDHLCACVYFARKWFFAHFYSSLIFSDFVATYRDVFEFPQSTLSTTDVCCAHRSVLNILDSLLNLLANQTAAKGVFTIVCRVEIRKMAEC